LDGANIDDRGDIYVSRRIRAEESRRRANALIVNKLNFHELVRRV